MIDADLLSKIPLFSGVSPAEIGALAGLLRERSYASGEVIFHQGDPGASLFIVRQGLVKISVTSPDGKQQTLALLGQGAFFGELSLFDEQPRSADAVALEAAHLLVLGREQLLPFLKGHPDMVLKVLVAVCRRLRRTDELVQDAAFLDIPGRLAKTIIELAENQGQRVNEGIVITARLTQTELATLVGATRESVNKWLGCFQDEGMLRYEHRRITVIDLEKLRREALLRAGEAPEH